MTAVVPHLVQDVKSAVKSPSSGRFTPAAMMPQFCRSLNGKLIEARYAPSTAFLSKPVRQSLADATAIVMESSSQLHIERSPWAAVINAGANHPILCTTDMRLRRRRGTYAP